MRSPRTALAGLVGLLMLATACSAASPTPAGTAITTALREYSIELSAATAPPGAVTFTVTNSGTMIHEFVVMKTDVKAAELPLTNDEVTEDNYTVVDEIDGLDAGKKATLTVTLAAGHYVFMCNIAGHVRLGMATDFTVQ